MDFPANDSLANKPSRKKKHLPSSQNPEILDTRTHSSRKGHKASKRGNMNEVSVGIQPDSMENEYRSLRRKYLLLEEERFGLGRELKVVEDDIKTLEDEKVSLLDELVVLEGLVDPMDNKYST